MQCEHALEWMSAYLDAELDASARVQVELHLDGCETCTAQLARLRALHGEIGRHASRYTAPPELVERIRLGIAAQQAAQVATQPAHPPAPSGRWRWPAIWPAGFDWRSGGAGALASAALVALLAAALPSLRAPGADELLERELVASHFRSLMPSHLTDVASTDQHTVKPWFAGKLDFSPPVLDLAPRGYPLIGGRLDYLAQRPVAALVYQYRKHLLNLYVWPAAGADAAPQASARQGFQLLRWRQDGMQFVLVSDVGAPQEADFARTLRAQMQSPAPSEAPPQLP